MISLYVERYRSKMSCMQFPFVQSSLGIGKDPRMNSEQLLPWHWSTLPRLQSDSWPGKLFSALECSRCHGHAAFKPKKAAPTSQLRCCTTLHGILAIQFFHLPTVFPLESNMILILQLHDASSFPKILVAGFC